MISWFLRVGVMESAGGDKRGHAAPYQSHRILRLSFCAIAVLFFAMPRHQSLALGVFCNRQNLLHRRIYEGIARFAAQRGRTRVELWSVERLRESRFMAETPCDGAIVEYGPDIAAPLRRAGIPVINVSSYHADCPFPSVTNDQEWAGRCAARYFLQRGYRHFGYAGFPPHHGSALRGAGFTAELAERGHSCAQFAFATSNAQTDEALQNSVEIRRRLRIWLKLRPRPLALFCFSDALASVVLLACQEAGWEVPAEIAVLGVDNDPLLTTQFGTALSSIDLGTPATCFRAAAVLVQWIETGRPPRPRQQCVRGTRIVTRTSTDRHAVEDPLIAQALDYINEHLVDVLTVDEIARNLATSRRTLERRFSSQFGYSIYEAVLRERLDRARDYITGSDTPLKEIAASCGFTDGRHLSVLFRRKLGFSPGDLRNRHGAKA